MINTEKGKLLLGGLAVLAVIIVGYVLLHLGTPMKAGSVNNGAQVQNYPYWFTTGRSGTNAVLYAGASQQWSVTDAGAVVNTGTEQLGTNGTTITQIQKGTCSLIMSSYTLAATTTVPADCAVTGVQSGDNVIGMFATSTALNGGWEIVGASASSTAGFVTFRVVNDTGASAIIPASIASSTQFLILR